MRSIILLLCLLMAIATVEAVSTSRRGNIDVAQQQQSAVPQTQGDLVSFLQQHQQAHAAQSSATESAPSLQAQQAAAQTVPAGATEATSDNVLMALEHTPSHRQQHAQQQQQSHSTHSLIQSGASAQHAVAAREAGEDGDGEDFGPCKTCVFVLERIKKGSNMLLPAICSELYHKYPDAYALCHQVLNALSINGNNVRYWLFEGCFKYEIYQSKEWIKPCPSHVMCSVLKDLSAEPFCPALPMENPFEDA